jgi:predicted transcriptional regulator
MRVHEQLRELKSIGLVSPSIDLRRVQRPLVVAEALLE